MINITAQVAAQKAEAAERTCMKYVGITYPHYQGELDELKAALIEKGCKVSEQGNDIVDVYFNDLYSGTIVLREKVWALVVTNKDLII